MRLSIVLNLDNAAFDPVEAEVARILRDYADLISREQLRPKILLDFNGNKVGSIRVS